MKAFKKILALSLLVCLLMTLAVEVFASGSVSGKVGTVTFTVTTGKKDSTLTIKPSSGKITATAWKNPLKGTTKTITKSGIYADYTVTVSGVGSKTMTNKKVTFNLAKNRTYTVTVQYRGIDFISTATCWNEQWKKNPSWKATASNGAVVK